MKKNSSKKLFEMSKELESVSLRELFINDSKRFDKYSLNVGEIFLDYSKNKVNDNVMGQLFKLASDSNLKEKISDMFACKEINTTENRAVLHVALRNQSEKSFKLNGIDIMEDINSEKSKMRALVNDIHCSRWKGYSGMKITDIVNIGIGGSDLGPKMVVEALLPYKVGELELHFISNVDGAAISKTLSKLKPESTLFIVASKTFTTQETLMNANTARKWVMQHYGASGDNAISKHFLAISSNLEETTKFGIPKENCFKMWDWVGGRYSLWSSIGLPIALSIGMDSYEELLEGAHEVDNHFSSADLETNMPVIMAMIGIWNCNFCGSQNQAILSYDDRLSMFVDYLQQADMESNGKQCSLDNKYIDYQTGVTLWGGVGTNGQHAFHQLLHQGTITIPVDFIIALNPDHKLSDHHEALVANCIAQSQALMSGKTEKEAIAELVSGGMLRNEANKLAKHKVIPGDKPSNTFIVESLSPRNLGSLIALYEHKIFVQGIIWNINSFDQWGVELGKQLARPILDSLQSKNISEPSYDCSTSGLLKKFI